MARSPNAEQLLAINHEGGVLLRAGAGSGKTFVLVEHIVYRTEQWMKEFKISPQGSFEEFIRQKFSQVVMMTFTKKAAGEMSIRLTEKFIEKSQEEGELQKWWMIANEALPMLMVTTIDGFCRKLITMGYFPHLSTEAKIIFDTERTDQVSELVLEWLEKNSSSLKPEILEIVIREKKAILSAFTNVFSDPGLRLMWKTFDFKSISPETVGDLLKKSFALNELGNAIGAVHALELSEDSDRSAFEKMIATFQASGLPEVDSVDKLTLYENIFSPIKVLSGERTAKKKSPAADAAKEGLVALRTWMKAWSPVIKDYQDHFTDKVLPWMKLNTSIFNFIEDRLDPNLGMTFGDIEYLVSLGLKNKADRERIQKTFNYFIVDEFQDTSNIQFQIVQALINGDYSRLFCVGDAKQAIYGFRGGELSVFQDCAELVPQVRSLANNYRSLPEIISFNNSLFSTLLPLGQNFEGHDPFSVDPEDQNIPLEVTPTEKGLIEVYSSELERDLETEGKFSNEEINRLEAIFLADAIKNERASTQNVCTVLYSKLRPSGELIRALMEREIGFTAQFKIDLMDDPILGMFVCLLRRQFDGNSETHDRYPLFLIQSYFNILGIDRECSHQELNDFDLDVKFWGLLEAFKKFLHKLHITNENADINLQTIETISDLYHQDPESIMVQLLSGSNQRLSLDLRSGEESHMVQIMSAHASKGLEFDSVYLGGVYTNGRDQFDGALFGDLPGSFHWYLDVSQREKQKSPLYLYENELAKFKNFSEAKRLFYVACTRAKKKMVWVEFGIPDKTFSIPKNSWILGLRRWMEVGMKEVALQEFKVQDFNASEVLKAQSLPQLPLFFHDPVGVHSKGESDTELMIAAELSVTRLNALLDCPRKFYLSNILKMAEPDKKIIRENIDNDNEELATVMRSSSERGTYIHAQIAQGILRNFVVPRESFGTEHAAPIAWALELLKTYPADYELIPERPMKFKLFNFMISGIPDLMLIPKGDKSAQIWDFKTGRITQENLAHYWLQLSTYAYALYELGQISKDSSVELVLCFVDQKQNLQKPTNWVDCQRDLYPVWRSQNEPWKINLDHCAQCSYGSICPR